MSDPDLKSPFDLQNPYPFYIEHPKADVPRLNGIFFSAGVKPDSWVVELSNDRQVFNVELSPEQHERLVAAGLKPLVGRRVSSATMSFPMPPRRRTADEKKAEELRTVTLKKDIKVGGPLKIVKPR